MSRLPEPLSDTRNAALAPSQNLASLLNSFSKVEQPDKALFRHISKILQVNFQHPSAPDFPRARRDIRAHLGFLKYKQS